MVSISERIEKFNEGLLPAEVAIKYKLLASNPFSFFRGTNHVFYEDLSKENLLPSPQCYISGDLHLQNFGTFKGDNRLVYFDLNDFDEGILAPVEWEIVRMITSIFLAFDSLKIKHEEAFISANKFLKTYSRVLEEGKPRYIDARIATGIVKRFLRKVERRSDNTLFLSRTVLKNGVLKLSSGKNKQLVIDKKLKKDLIEAFKPWMESNNALLNHYKVLDVRFRLAGTGSLGVKRYVFLIEKITDKTKHMLIDMKQGTASSLVPFVITTQPQWKSEADRMVTIQKVMQNTSPAHLSTLAFEGDSYIMQEMQPSKDRINFKLIQNNFKEICAVLEDMALISASAHLRSVGRKGTCSAEELIGFGKDHSWHKKVLEYALRYKGVMQNYHKEFKSEIKNKKM
jgi:uncharacterized protein (DUF2252 family)